MQINIEKTKAGQYLLFPLLCILFGCFGHRPDGESQYRDFAPDGIPFTVADSAWNVDSVGNHRAVVQVTGAKQNVVKVTLPWRRPDMRPETKKIVVVDATTGRKTKNVAVIEFSAEKGVVAFEPQTVPGKYYVYYLPYKFRTGWDDARYGKPWNDYLPPVYNANPDWAKTAKTDIESLPEAKVVRFEARSRFDFFTPMGLIATANEIQTLKQKAKGDFTIFPEDRAFPIRLSGIPARWVASGPSHEFEGYAMPGEYYVWQIGLWAAEKEMKNVRLEFGDFRHSSRKNMISRNEVTCFNLEGTNWDGQPIAFDVNVPSGKVQALWCGFQIPKNVGAGTYVGTVTVSAENATPQTVEITIRTGKEIMVDNGDNDLWRHSRLRWLNSTIGTDNLPVAPYEALQLDGNKITATGKTLLIGSSGLPQSVEINGRKILDRPMSFVVETDRGNIVFDATNVNIEKKADGLIAWNASSEQNGINFDCSAYMEYDGYLRYHVKLSAADEISVKDIKLVASYTPEASEYFMGVGNKGGNRPANYAWDWKGPWDSYWIGGDQAGLQTEFRGGAYHGPLLNDYKPAPPETWANDGLGKIHVTGNKGQSAMVIASTGKNTISADIADFEFALLITPVKPVNTAKHFSERYYHNDPAGFAEAAKEGANIANIHHSWGLNPVINYPFIVRDPLKEYIREQHAAGRKVKLYYTIRELTSHAVEVHALKSLNHEIFASGVGHGVPWLCEHLIDDYKPAWYTELPGQTADAALVLNGFSRWINYYLEGLRWMFENYEIDGIYMDDVAFDREVMKRMRKIMARYRPGAVIDLHSNTAYSIGPANQYAGFFPYVDRLWFGESFKYNQMLPDEWFVTFSGIPFGLMSEMLQDGGNRYLGMVYGTTARHSYGQYSPAPVWNLWKTFGIEQAQMIGYWDEACPVKTNRPDVKATVFVRPDKILIALGNFGDTDQTVNLSFDWEKLGLDSSKVVVAAPHVEDFQEEQVFKTNDAISIKSKEGKLLIVSKP